jgi:polyisoprenoid-binding protein YceI
MHTFAAPTSSTSRGTPRSRSAVIKSRSLGATIICSGGDLTIRGVTRKVPLKVTYLGQWQTPWWEDGVDKGPKTRAGFQALTEINRHDFGVSWNTPLARNGIAVGHVVQITVDVEAILMESRGT